MTVSRLQRTLLDLSNLRGATTAAAVTILATSQAWGQAAGGSSAAAAQSDDQVTLNEIVIVGAGETRQIQSVTATQLELAIPGTSPLAAVAQLPGVVFNSADPVALDPWSQSIYVRGFASDQLGYTLDGLPLGQQGYGTYNGMNIGDAISPENLIRVDVSQGAGGVDIASTSNLGGAVQFFSRDPASEMGATVSQMFGTPTAYRTFARVDTGEMNSSGTKMFFSYGRTTENKWKGNGNLFQEEVNAKLVQPLGSSGTLSAYFSWTQEGEPTYDDESLEIWHKLGPDVDYYLPNYAAAYHAAQGVYPAAYNVLSDPLDASYYDGPSTDTNYFGSVTLQEKLTDNIVWKTSAYYQSKNFNAWYTTPYVSSPNGAPLSEEKIANPMQREGGLTDLTMHFGINSINAGVWYEHYRYAPYLGVTQEPILGEGTPFNPLENQNPQLFDHLYGYVYNTDSIKFHLQDSAEITSQLTAHAGFASVNVHAEDRVQYNDPNYTGQATLPTGGLTSSGAFLPQVGLNWRFAPENEIYADISKNMRSYDEGDFGSATAWGVSTQEAFNAAKSSLKPEQDWVYEGGYRLTAHDMLALVSVYHTHFMNRQQFVSEGSIINLQGILANVGSVDLNGAEAALTVYPVRGLSFYNSVSFNKSTFQNDLTTGGVTYDLKGKQEPNYPEWVYKSTLAYTFGPVQAHLDATYMGKREYSYTNDTSVPAYWLTNVGASYDLGSIRFAKNLKVSVNVYNLTDRVYVSDMGEFGNPLSGDAQSIQIGAPREFFATISANF